LLARTLGKPLALWKRMTISNLKNRLPSVPSGVSDLARRLREAGAHAADQAGAVGKSGGDLARRAADAAREKGGAVAQAGGDLASRAMDAAREKAAVAGKAARDAGHVASVFVSDVPRAAIDKGAHLAQALGKKAAKAVAETGVLAPFDAKQKIGELQPGDTWKLGAGAKASMEDTVASANSSTTVTRNQDGSFTVGTSDDGSGGLSASEHGGELSGALGAGGRVEYQFATAAEAQRGVMATQRARVGMASSSDLEFLSAHRSAFELSGNAAAELALKLNLGSVAMTPSLGVQGDHALRIELKPRPALIVRDTLSTTVKADVGHKDPGASLSGATTSVDARAVVERRFDLSALDAAALARDPAAQLQKQFGKAVRSQHDTVTLSTAAKGSALGNGSGASAKVSFDYPADALGSSGALETLMKTGDLSRAGTELGDATHVRATLSTNTTRGIAVAGGAGNSALGAKGSFESTTTHSSDIWQYPAPGSPPATVSDAARAIASLPPARRAFSGKP
jgi:hypothetical protein